MTDVNIVARFVKALAILENNVLTIKRILDHDKPLLNGHRIFELDLSVNANVVAILELPYSSHLSPISLNLSQCNLHHVPDAFEDLKIIELNLAHNSFKEIPKCIIKGCKFIQKLDVSNNQLSYFEEPACVKKLRVLYMNNNKFNNVPDWILKLRAFNLEELDYSFNDMTTWEGSSFHQVSTYELKNLKLKNCALRNIDIVYIKNIKTLTKLDLSNADDQRLFNCLTTCDDLFRKPRWDDRLKALHLNNLGISDLPDDISRLISLEELFLNNNDLLWLPDSITSLKNLRVLSLAHNKLVCLPNSIHKFENLEILNLAHNSISTFTYACLRSLKTLDLYDNIIESWTEIGDVKIDLEKNYLDTSLLGQKYEKLKELLRLELDENRGDGQKQNVQIDLDSSSRSSYSSVSDETERVCFQKACEDKHEDSWSSDSMSNLCNNGCTTSDNEWTGCEEKVVLKPKRKKSVNRYPSWTFEDALL